MSLTASCIRALSWENQTFECGKTKEQLSFAVLSNCEADQRLCFFYTDITYNSSSTYTQNFKILAYICGFIDLFESDLIRNHSVVFPCCGSYNLRKRKVQI